MEPQYIAAQNLSNTRFGYLYRTSKHSQLIYLAILAALLSLLASLPFIKITISVKGIGQVSSEHEKTDIIIPANGIITVANIKENRKVKKGDLLIAMDSSSDNRQIRLISKNIDITNLHLKDLENLLNFTNIPHLETNLYRASWQQYSQELEKIAKLVMRNKMNYEKYDILRFKKVVSEAEFEQYRFSYEQALAEKQILIQNFKKQWEMDVEQYHNTLLNLLDQKASLGIQAKQLQLKATIAGSLQNLKGLQIGTQVFATQKIGEISPDGNLLAVCYLKPADIGLIRLWQVVKFQLDAFDYRYWGMVMGFVSEISDDVVLINNLPFFKVKCTLKQHHLQLKNGFQGQIKKGMTFTANFSIAERSLFQLIYDQIDDWTNPNH